jgi:hypothetical protein
MPKPALCALTAGLLLAAPAAGETAFTFEARDAARQPLTVYVDGKPVCHADAGKTCRVLYTNVDAPLSFSLGKGAPQSFDPGDIDIVQHCSFDTAGAHCVDADGISTQ